MLPLLTNPVALGIVALAWVGASVWGLVSGWHAGAQDNVVKAQDEMRKHIANTMKKIRPYYFSANLAAGQRCLVDQYFDGLCRVVVEQVDTLASRKSAEAKDEADRLGAQAQLDDQARQAQAERAKHNLATWDQVGQALATLTDELEALDEATAVPA